MSDIRDVLKNNLISYSKSKKISQKELSDRLGVTQSAVSHWFKGDNSPNIEIVAKIANILSVPISALLSESEINLNLEAKALSADESVPGEDKLIKLYRRLNEEGQDKLIDYADDLVASGKYIKTSSNQLGNEKLA